MLFDIKVQVELKDGVLDTAGKAVSKSLTGLDLVHVPRTVRIGKLIRLQIEAPDRQQAEGQVREMCDRLFANPVIEQYDYSIEEA